MPDRDLEGFRPELPAALQPPELRRSVEREIVVRLAGTIGEELAGPRSGFISESSDRKAAQHLAEELAALSPRHLELIEAEPDHAETDLERAHTLAHGFGGDEAIWHVTWLGQVARRLVYELAIPIRSLADELMRHDVMTGAEVQRAIQHTSHTAGEVA